MIKKTTIKQIEKLKLKYSLLQNEVVQCEDPIKKQHIDSELFKTVKYISVLTNLININ
jgi:hypothetical protein